LPKQASHWLVFLRRAAECIAIVAQTGQAIAWLVLGLVTDAWTEE